MAAFKVDENLPVEATIFLQEAGLDALSIHDQDMVGSTDSTIKPNNFPSLSVSCTPA